METKKLKLGNVLFEGFELLDVYGPLEMFSLCENIELVMVAERAGKIRSSAGPCGVADQAIADCNELDILLIPGGIGTRKQVENASFLLELNRLSSISKFVCTVCTGTSLLARAGVLDGLKATTNKISYKWVITQGP